MSVCRFKEKTCAKLMCDLVFHSLSTGKPLKLLSRASVVVLAACKNKSRKPLLRRREAKKKDRRREKKSSFSFTVYACIESRSWRPMPTDVALCREYLFFLPKVHLYERRKELVCIFVLRAFDFYHRENTRTLSLYLLLPEREPIFSFFCVTRC